MFCAHCGTENENSAAFCLRCGEPLIPDPAATAPAVPVAPVTPAAPAAPAYRPARKRSLKPLIAVLILVAVVITGWLLIFRSPRMVVNRALRAFKNANAKAIYKLIPDDVLDEVYSSTSSKNDAIEDWAENMEDITDDLNKYYDKWSYEIIDIQKLSGENLDNLQEDYKDEYNCRITAAKRVYVKWSFTDDEDYSSYYIYSYTVIKVGGKWYLSYSSARSIMNGRVYS